MAGRVGRKKITGFIIGTALLVAFLSLIPAAYQICETNPHTEHESCAAYQVLPFLLLKIGKFLDAAGVALTAIFTVVLAFSTIALWKATVRLATDAQTTATLQASDTRILQRAYLSVEPGGIGESSDPYKSHPNIKIVNAGNLPARNIRWVIDLVITQDHRLPAPPVDKARAEGQNTLTPGGSMSQGGPIIYVGTGPTDARNEAGLYIYVYGGVYYDDGFGQERRTMFCHRYNCANLETIQEPVEPTKRLIVVGHKIMHWFARYHRYGNDAD